MKRSLLIHLWNFWCQGRGTQKVLPTPHVFCQYFWCLGLANVNYFGLNLGKQIYLWSEMFDSSWIFLECLIEWSLRRWRWIGKDHSWLMHNCHLIWGIFKYISSCQMVRGSDCYAVGSMGTKTVAVSCICDGECQGVGIGLGGVLKSFKM